MQDPGGIINLVTKKPLYDFSHEIYAGAGNNHYYNYDSRADYYNHYGNNY